MFYSLIIGDIYFTSYLHLPSPPFLCQTDSVPAMDLGPIAEWYVSGFDGGESVIIGVTTPFGEYYLMEPSADYAQFMERVREKIYMSKIVIEFLIDEKEASYEDLLIRLQVHHFH